MANGNILLAEDEEAVRSLAKRILESSGYTVYDYESAEEGLEMISTLDSIDLVISDIVLPGISGAQMAKELKVKFPELTVLFMSGFASSSLEYINDLEDGSLFLSKPFTRKLLLQKVANLMQ